MTHTFKLSRRTARLRAAVATAAALAFIAACNNDDLTDPTHTDTPSSPTNPADPSFYTASTAPGIPFGLTMPPADQYANTSKLTGALKHYTPGSWALNDLATARKYGARVVVSLAGNRSSFKNSDGTFSMTKWKYNVAKWRSVSGFSGYVTDGTIIGHFLIDEPNWAGGWGGKMITQAQIEEMARYSKSIWPNMATGARVRAGYLIGYAWHYLDFAWAQYEGPLHVPSANMSPSTWVSKETSDAQKAGVRLVFGLNYLDGGDGSSGIHGTYDLRTSSGKTRWQMSASEVTRVGKIIAAAPYACAVISWAWSADYAASSYLTSTQLSGIRNFVKRSDVQSALGQVAYTARNRSKVSCKR